MELLQQPEKCRAEVEPERKGKSWRRNVRNSKERKSTAVKMKREKTVLPTCSSLGLLVLFFITLIKVIQVTNV